MASYQELLSQKAELERQIEAARKQELSDAISQIKTLMAQYGLTVDDLSSRASGGKASGGKSSAAKGSKVAPKYRNPATGDTWTGRGRQPKWVEQALASGKSLTDLAI
jgi:DNA-binding protein H-NS